MSALQAEDVGSIPTTDLCRYTQVAKEGGLENR